jgi:lipid-binding SYLF domain-containing protein
MKIKVAYITSAAVATVLLAANVRADDELHAESQQAVANFLKVDPSMRRFFDQSAGYAIFPDIGKGGLIVGAARGKGLVYATTNLVGEATMTQGSIGAQVGGQTFAEIIFFENAATLEDFKAGKLEMSAEVSAVAAAEGTSRTASYKMGVAVFTLPKKGLMVQASVGGQKFKFEPLR